MTLRRRVAQATLISLAASMLLWVGAGAASAPARIDSGASAPECPAERFRSFVPIDDDQYTIDQRVKFALPTDPATRDRADIETAQRAPEDDFTLDFTMTDEENAAFRRTNDHQDQIQPLRDYFATIPDAVGAVAFNGKVLDPLFRVETTTEVSATQLSEIERLTPRDVPTVAVTVEWSRSELQALIGDIGAGIRGEPTPLGAFVRIVELGIVPHSGGIGPKQYIEVFVDETAVGCDAQLTALVADALADLNVPPIVIQQGGRARDD